MLPVVWNLERPDEVLRLACEYVQAGSRVLLTNTFCAAPAILGPLGYDSTAAIAAAVKLAREAARDRAFVAASLSTASESGATSSESGEEYRRQAKLFIDLEVDAIVIETMTAIDDLRFAVRSANDVRGDTPLVACMTFDSESRAPDGTSPEELAWVLEDLGADAVGVNCCDGPETALRVVAAFSRATDLPIWAKPNAGLPECRVSDGEFADYSIRIVAAGASAIGGCCGTTPATIRAVAAALGLTGTCR